MQPKIVVMCVDGFLNSGDIFGAVQDAAATEEVDLSLNEANFVQTISQVPLGAGSDPGLLAQVRLIEILISLIPDEFDLDFYTHHLNQLRDSNGGDSAALRLLIVGMSYGAAKMYKYLVDHSSVLQQFEKVAVVLVDAHEPGTPGDDGTSGGDYDYVDFDDREVDRDYYNLQWRTEWETAFGLAAHSLLDPNSRLRIYNIYQRKDSLWKGYSFVNEHVDDRKLSAMNGSDEPTHRGMADCTETIQTIQEAFLYLKYFSPKLTFDSLEKTVTKAESGNRIDLVEATFSLTCPEQGDLPRCSVRTTPSIFQQTESLSGYAETRTVSAPIDCSSLGQGPWTIEFGVLAPTNWSEQKLVRDQLILHPAEFVARFFVGIAPPLSTSDHTDRGYDQGYPSRGDDNVPHDLTGDDVRVMHNLGFDDQDRHPATISMDANTFFQDRERPSTGRTIAFGAAGEVGTVWYFSGYIKSPIKCALYPNHGWATSPEPPRGEVKVVRTGASAGESSETSKLPHGVFETDFTPIGASGRDSLSAGSTGFAYDDATYNSPLVKDDVTFTVEDDAGQKVERRTTLYARYLFVVTETTYFVIPRAFATEIVDTICDPLVEVLEREVRQRAKNAPTNLTARIRDAVQAEMIGLLEQEKAQEAIREAQLAAGGKLVRTASVLADASAASVQAELEKTGAELRDQLQLRVVRAVYADLLSKVGERVLKDT